MLPLRELIVELSNNCNLCCRMCGYWQDGFDEQRFMSFGLFKKIIDVLGPNADAIRLNGRGESTIHPHFSEMLDYTKSKLPDANITLFTNLSFNNERIIKQFIRHNIQLFFSIDSPDRDELEDIRLGCDYDVIMNNMRALSMMEKIPFIVFTLQENNLHRIKDIGEFACANHLNIIYNVIRRDDGIEEFVHAFKSDIEAVRTAFNEVRILYLLSGLKSFIPSQIAGVKIELNGANITFGQQEICPALHSELCILYNGNVTPCNMFNPYIYGNINNESLDNILNGTKRKQFIKKYKLYYYCMNCACMGQ